MAIPGGAKACRPADDSTKARLRQQPLEWLNSEFVSWGTFADSNSAGMKAKFALFLQHWKTDTDLSSIRDNKELARLPDDERSAFQKL
jgi:hypothetical protein